MAGPHPRSGHRTRAAHAAAAGRGPGRRDPPQTAAGVPRRGHRPAGPRFEDRGDRHRRRRRRDRGRARHRHRRVAGHRQRRGARGARRDGALRPRRRRGARAPHRNRGTTPGARPGRDHGRGRAGDAAEGHGQVRRLGPGHHQRAAPEQARPAQHHADPLVHQALRDQAERARARAGAAARHRSRDRRRRELRDRPRRHQGGRARLRAASRPVARRHPAEPLPTAAERQPSLEA